MPPPVFSQAGRLTQESRGKLISVALSRLGERWARIVVSDRAPLTVPYSPFAPARVSEPISR